MKIVIPDDYQDAVRTLECFSKLEDHVVVVYPDSTRDLEVLSKRFGEADALVLSRDRTVIGKELLARLPRLRLISQAGAKVPHIDVDACTAQGVAVAVSTEDILYSVAELAWGLILGSMRRIPLENRQLREGRWQTTMGQGLRGRVLGIFGLGSIGAMVAEIGKAFGMRVMVWGRQSTLARAKSMGYLLASDKNELFERSDVLSLHIRLTPETRGIVTLEDLSRMKPDALFVNTSRSGLVSDHTLAQALRLGRPGYAAVDVFDDEPVTDTNHPLLRMDNVVCTPHLGGVVVEKYEYFFGRAFDQITAFAAGSPINIINPAALTRHAGS